MRARSAIARRQRPSVLRMPASLLAFGATLMASTVESRAADLAGVDASSIATIAGAAIVAA